MICSKCGAYVEEGCRFCQECGAKMSAPSAAPAGKLKIRMGGGTAGTGAGQAGASSASTSASAPKTSAFSAAPPVTPPAPPPVTPPAPPPVTPPPAASAPYAPPPAAAPAAAYLPVQNSRFDGTFLGFLGVTLVTNFLSLITLGLAFPWLWCYKQRWIYEHTCINGYRLYFDGRGVQLIGKWLLWLLLTIITLTLFAFWIPLQLKKWEIKHVSISGMVINPR